MTSPPAGRSARPVCGGAGIGPLRCRAPMLLPGTERRRPSRARRIQLRYQLTDRRFAHSPPAPRSRPRAPQPPVPEHVLDHAARLAKDARRALHANRCRDLLELAGRLLLRRLQASAPSPARCLGVSNSLTSCQWCVSRCQLSVFSYQFPVANLVCSDFPFPRFPLPFSVFFFPLPFTFSAFFGFILSLLLPRSYVVTNPPAKPGT